MIMVWVLIGIIAIYFFLFFLCERKEKCPKCNTKMETEEVIIGQDSDTGGGVAEYWNHCPYCGFSHTPRPEPWY